MAKIGFIGMGNMGHAILKGALKEYPAEEMIFCAKTSETKTKVHAETGVEYTDNNAECANRCKYLVLAVKPQFYEEVLKEIRYMVTPEHVLISLAPGKTIDQLKQSLGNDKRIVRVMPNTPAMIGEGMTGVSVKQGELSGEEMDEIKKLFDAFGKTEFIEERLMDAVVCASGSSPAFVYQFGRQCGQIWYAKKASLCICGTGSERCGCHGVGDWRTSRSLKRPGMLSGGNDH